MQQQQLANRDKEKIAKCLPPATGYGLQRALGISHGVSGCFAHDICIAIVNPEHGRDV